MDSINYNTLIEEMREEVKEVITKEKICGLAIALVDDDKIIWSEGFGFTDITKKEKVTADTLFSTQSMGKTVTATTFMILASKGLIDLDDPIRKHYPEFVVNTKFGNRDKEIEKITFRRMLSHTASFTHEAAVGNNFDDAPCTKEEHIASIADTWLRSKVGSEFAYANIGLDLTGYVLGKIMKKTFPDVVKEELFQPIGIKKATLDIDEALSHSFAKGTIGEFQTPTVQVPMLGAGGVYISVNEQAKIAMLHLNKGKANGKQLISKEHFEEMYKPQFEEDGVKNKYSLGIYKENPINGVEVYCHGGGGYGYQTQHSWILDHKISAIVFTNSAHHSGEQVKLARKALGLMYKEKTKPKVVYVEPRKLKKLVGTYFGHRISMRNIVYEDEKLYVFNTFGKKQILYPQSELEYLTEDGNKFTFILDKQEKVKLLKWITNDFLFHLKQNDTPNDEIGPNKQFWEKFLGIYKFTIYGIDHHTILNISNGYLYLYLSDNLKLEEYQNNVFFTGDGESFLLDEDKINYGNIPLTKTELNIDELLEECKSNIHKKHGFKGSYSGIAEILNLQKGFDVAYDFILKTIEIDEIFKDNLRNFGNQLYAYRKIENAKKCFEKLVSLDKEDKKAEEMIEKISKEQNL